MDRRARVYGAALFVVALSVRVVYLLERHGTPGHELPLVDSQGYDNLARALAGGGGLSADLFWQAPFYPCFLAIVYALTGGSMVAARLVQAVLGSLTCVLTFALGRRVGGIPTGIVAGLVTATYGPLFYFDGELLATGWACFWAVALVGLLLRIDGNVGWARYVVTGACFCLAVITRPTFLPFALFASIWVIGSLRREGLGWRQVSVRLLLATAGFAAIGLPVAGLNRSATGRFSILPASGGINLYIGNNPDRARTINIRPGWEWDALTRSPALDGVVRKQDTSRYFQGKVLDYARDDPAGLVGGLATKSLASVSSRELPRNLDVYVFREWSQLLAITVWRSGGFGFPFGLLFPLAVAGFFVSCRRLPGPVPGFAIVYGLAIVLVFAGARYRTPLVPVLAIPAAAGVLAVVEAARKGLVRPLIVFAAIAAVCLSLSIVPGPFPQERIDYRAELDYHRGNRAAGIGDLGEAERWLGKALERQPSFGDAHAAIGHVYHRQRRIDPAIDHYRRAIEIAPKNSDARGNLGRAWLLRRRPALAEEQFRQALELRPFNAGLHHGRALALTQLDRFDESVSHYRESLDLGGAEPSIHNNFGAALLRLNRYPEAIEQFEAALSLEPLHLGALDNLAHALGATGRLAEALSRFRDALETAEAQGAQSQAKHLRQRIRGRRGSSP